MGLYSTVYCMLCMCESRDKVYSVHTKKVILHIPLHPLPFFERIER